MPPYLPVEAIQHRIRLLRDQRILIDSDLATLYGVPTKQLNKAVQRNLDRFPSDFMFQLTVDEVAAVDGEIAHAGRGGRRYLPYAFTQEGIAMLSSVLRSPQAVAVNILIMRAFVRLREAMLVHADLARKLIELERKYDGQFQVVFDALRALMDPPAPPHPQIGFHTKPSDGIATKD